MLLTEYVIVSAAAALILVAAWQDFTSWKIRNWTVLALLGVYICLALWRWLAPAENLAGGVLYALGPSTPIYGDVAAGLLLFTIGVVLWALRMLGAGDAKLFFPIGLFVGLNYLFPFAVALALGAIVGAVALKFPVPLHYQVWPAGARIEEIRQSGKVPYGVVMAGAALIAMYLRYL
jgi:prepilin peptidase CpaA